MGFLSLRPVHTDPLAICHLYIRFPTTWDALYLPVCVSDFMSNTLPCDLSRLMDLRRVVYVQCVQLFLVGWRTQLPSSSYAGPETGCPYFILLFNFIYYSSHQNFKFYEDQDFFLICSLQPHQGLEQCLTHSRQSDNISLKKLNK